MTRPSTKCILFGIILLFIFCNITLSEESETKDKRFIFRKNIISESLLKEEIPDDISNRKFGIGVKIMGGGNYIAVGDLNSDIKGYTDNITDLSGVSPQGEAKPIHFGLSFEGQIQVDLFDKFGIFFGAGYIQTKKESQLIYEVESQTLKVKYFPKVSTIPIKAGIYYYPLKRLYINLGLDYYVAECSYSRRLEYETIWVETVGNADGKGLGFHGGVGVEFPLSKNFIFLIEAQGKYAKVGNFKGKREYISNLMPQSEEEGYLYYYETQRGNKTYGAVTISEIEPLEGSNVRKAEVDFGGFAIVCGVKIRL